MGYTLSKTDTEAPYHHELLTVFVVILSKTWYLITEMPVLMKNNCLECHFVAFLCTLLNFKDFDHQTL